MDSVRPIDDKLLVRPHTPAERTASGIYLTGDAVEKQQWGEVLAIGGTVNDPKKSPDIINPGDKIVWNKYAGTDFKFDKLSDQEFHVIPRSAVIATRIPAPEQPAA